VPGYRNARAMPFNCRPNGNGSRRPIAGNPTLTILSVESTRPRRIAIESEVDKAT
jgi:hypothetical protein